MVHHLRCLPSLTRSHYLFSKLSKDFITSSTGKPIVNLPSSRINMSTISTTTAIATTQETTDYVFPPSPIPSVSIQVPEGSKPLRFPIHRIYCVGRNYSEHVQEMGGDPTKSVPTFFTKPADAVVESPAHLKYPLATQNLHYEVELVVCIGKGGVQIPIDSAMDHIFGYAVGLDLTKRDLQSAAKAKGMPWDCSKAFDESAPIGPIVPIEETALIGGMTTTSSMSDVEEEGSSRMLMSPQSVIQLSVNGIQKQYSSLDQMIWSVPQIIHQLSYQFHLQPGDLIFTGTPSGVGPIVPGDTIIGSVQGLPSVEMTLRKE